MDEDRHAHRHHSCCPTEASWEATGRRITLRGTCASFVENGKVATHREYFDQLELYTQLGMHLAMDDPAAA